MLAATGSKLASVTGEQAQENQDAVTVTQSGNTITINGDVDTLNEYTQGTAGKWVGLAIDTGEDSIIGVSKDDYAFTETDVTEATSYELDEGSFVLWVDAAGEGESFTLSKEGRTPIDVTIVINDTGE